MKAICGGNVNEKGAREQLSGIIWAEWLKRGGAANCSYDEFWEAMKDYSIALAEKAIEDGFNISKSDGRSAFNMALTLASDARWFQRKDADPVTNAEDPFWKDIEGYDGAYSVCYWGEVRSNKSGIRLSMRVAPRGKGYVYVSLWKDGKEKKFYVHRLVAQAFVPNPEGKLTVNHKNGNTFDNSRQNLEWMTHQEQQDHAWATGLTNNRGENCGTSKLTACDVSAIKAEFKAGGVTQTALAKKFGVTQPQISKIINDKQWSDQ